MIRNTVASSPSVTYEMAITVWRDGINLETRALGGVVPSRAKADEVALDIVQGYEAYLAQQRKQLL